MQLMLSFLLHRSSFSFHVFVSNFFFFLKPNLLGFFGVLLLGFSNLLILFLGFVGFFCIDWFVRSWLPFGWKENFQENAMIAKKITCILCDL